MSRIATAHSENALANLRTLLEVNAQMAREDPDERLDGSPNDEVRDVIADVLESAADHRDVLASLIRDWESHMTRPRPRLKASVDARLSARELIESWIAIKDASRELCEKAAEHAPTARIRRRLHQLAEEEEEHAARLRDLL